MVWLRARGRHARLRAGHPRFYGARRKTWMAGSSPAMTTAFCEEKDSRTSSLLFLLVHRQHALGDQEATENIDRGEGQRDEAERARPQWPIIVGDQRYT